MIAQLLSFALPYALAALGGALSFVSPCILPLIPAYLSFITGYTLEERELGGKKRRTVTGTFFFGLGFSLVFVLLGATAAGIGRILIDYQDALAKIFGVIVILLGFHLTGVIKLMPLYKEKRIPIKVELKTKRRFLQPFVMGIAFSLGWTPCITPVLAGILTLAAQQQSVYKGVILLAFYSAGLWIPFMVAALFTAPILNLFSRSPKIASRASIVAGILLIIMGALLFTGQIARITTILA